MDGRPHPARDVDEHHVGSLDLTHWRTRTGHWLAEHATRLAAVLGPHTVLLVTLVVAGVLLTGLTAASAELYEQVDEGEGVAVLDRPVLDAVVALRTDPVAEAVTLYTDLGGPIGMPVLATVATLALALSRRRWTPVVLMLAATAGSLAMTFVGKMVIRRTRPPLMDAVPPFEESASFPSGHALNSVVVAGVIAYLLVRRQSSAVARTLTLVAATAFAVTMGLSRVYLGHHWLTDVLVAWTLGLAWLTVVVVAHRLYLTAHRRGVSRRQSVSSGPATSRRAA